MDEIPLLRTSERGDFKRAGPLSRGRPLDWKERTDEERKEALRNRRWRAQLKWRYGLTPRRYYEQLKKQKGLCAICDKKLVPGRTTHVDHEGGTAGVTGWNGGRFRGILCGVCNMRLGYFEKYQERILEYLGIEVIK